MLLLQVERIVTSERTADTKVRPTVNLIADVRLECSRSIASIGFDSVGLTLWSPGVRRESVCVSWSSIAELCVRIDSERGTIVMFETWYGESGVQIDELQHGFDVVVRQLHAHLTGLTLGWMETAVADATVDGTARCVWSRY
jgi:hypothetical protein